jgi:hypothetical protein
MDFHHNSENACYQTDIEGRGGPDHTQGLEVDWLCIVFYFLYFLFAFLLSSNCGAVSVHTYSQTVQYLDGMLVVVASPGLEPGAVLDGVLRSFRISAILSPPMHE